MNIDKYFSTRRTVRRYDSSHDVSESEILKMLEAAAQAPNTGNMQIYSVIITKDEEQKKLLAPTHFNQPSVMGASAVLTFCIDLNRFNRWCQINDAIPGMNNLQGFTWGIIDATIFAQQFCTIAEMNGLGTCYLGTTTYNAEAIAKALSLPESVIPVITLTVGYPAENPEISDRLPIKAIAHSEHYYQADASEISRIYAEKEQLPSSHQFVEENGKENLAQVFAEVRYPKEANEHFSHVYKEFVKNQGIQL
ncbi:MAG: nitroreductase family protein [Duncaniella sp.]|nr:nitroreductase family protein [Muribaculum sp.]MCM1254526.1 nitroreductase family protein [Duncaniella sp.]